LAYGDLEPYLEDAIKVVDKNGNEHQRDGKRLFKIYVVKSPKYLANENSASAPYRVYAFLDYDPDTEELYLEYNKVELNKFGALKVQELGYRELINPRSYFTYQPEESDVIDRSQEDLKVYSTKPASLKEKILGIPQQNSPGWKIFVPKKAIPDPRIFQLFRWRVACEFTRPITKTELGERTNITMRVGVVVPKNGTYSSTRANFLFHELGESDYNVAGIKFINPINSTDGDPTLSDREQASYWHVDIDSVSLDDLSKFDILVWAPVASVNVSKYLPKIKYFTETVGGTLIFETSSHVKITGIPGISYGTDVVNSSMRKNTTSMLDMSTLRFFDATPEDEDDTFTNFGKWRRWPPDVRDILTSYSDTASIVKSASRIAGWDIEEAEEPLISPYLDEIATLTDAKWQKLIVSDGFDWKTILEARETSTTNYSPAMVNVRYNSGGNIFVSSACIFEDHLFNQNGQMLLKTLQNQNINNFAAIKNYESFDQLVDSSVASVEMKIRVNILLLSTIFKPSSSTKTSSIVEMGLSNNSDTQSITIYSDWQSSWVINPEKNVLTTDEINEFNFVLQPTTVNGGTPHWQRVLSDLSVRKIIDKKIKELDPDGVNPVFNTFPGAEKRYFVITTNQLVETPSTDMLTDDSLVSVWTDAYSPAFEVPAEMGPYHIRDEMVAGTGASEGRRIYPPKAYELQTKAYFSETDAVNDSVLATIEMTGTLFETITFREVTITRKIFIPPTSGRYVDRVLHWNPDGANQLTNQRFRHQVLSLVPLHMYTWSDANYDVTKTTCWPYMGESGVISRTVNSTGDRVKRVQSFLNQCWYFKLITAGPFVEDGVYGPKTEAAIIEFQAKYGAQYVDGIIDAETWSLIGYALIGFSTISSADGKVKIWMRDAPVAQTSWATQARYSMRLETISDNVLTGPYYAKQSRYTGGPSTIREGFNVGFGKDMLTDVFDGNTEFTIYGMRLLPYLVGHNSVSLDWLDVRNEGGLILRNYDYTRGNPGRITGKKGGDSQWIDLNFNPIELDTTKDINIIFRLTQTGPSGWGTSRMLGIRDVEFYAKTYFPGNPSYYADADIRVGGRTVQVEKQFRTKFTHRFKAGEPVTFNPLSTNIGRRTIIFSDNNNEISPLGMIQNMPDIDLADLGDLASLQQTTLTEIRWYPGSIVITPTAVVPAFDAEFSTKKIKQNKQEITINQVTINYQGGSVSTTDYIELGDRFGAGQATFWTKTPENQIEPFSRTHGWISKQDGLRLICNQDGSPFGFPALPQNVSGDPSQIHFTKFSLHAFNTDQTVYYGFYDNARKEFITNTYGEPEISYYDYVRRGPQNVFISVQTTYELDTNSNIPNNASTIDRPFKWIMPVYGVTTNLKSKIQIDPLSPDLTIEDPWGIPIKTGSFAKDITLRSKSEGSLTNYLKNYQGENITAFYEIKEAENASWSTLFGRPYVDVKGETPIILDDSTIKVRQAPILMVQEATEDVSLADPWRPVFDVYVRRTINSDWQKLNFVDIKDYNAWTGEIILSGSLFSNDPRLVKVDYTSKKQVFELRHDGTNRINLNPYTNFNPTWTNVPLYVYILPAYITNKDGIIIDDSIRTRTVQVSLTSDIFNSNKIDYDPTAILLGIVYISTAMNIEDLLMLDTRKRGGGAVLNSADLELAKQNFEIHQYVDVEPHRAEAYQAGGFVIIRIPKELGEFYTEEQVKAIINKNITAGVRFKLEDLQGQEISFQKVSS
jgi:peptidoglycan hydrolase-like protein with peptidoglycan-binding domain